MEQEVMGIVTAVTKQWWLKVNTKAVRTHALDGAVFPHIVTVQYTVDEVTYTKRKWISAGYAVPSVGATIAVRYDPAKPKRATIQYTPTRFLVR